MWIEYIILSLCLLYVFGSVQTKRLTLLKFGPGRKNTEVKDGIVLRELGVWELMLELPLFFFFHWTRPTYLKSMELAQKYGPLLVFKVRKLFIIQYSDYIGCTDLDASKAIMTSSNWSDRFHENHYLFKASFGKPYGFLFAGGKYYKRASKLALKLLHQFEFFKPCRMEGLVTFEASELAAALEHRIGVDAEKNGQHGRKWLTFTPHAMFQRNTLNAIWQVVVSSRFEVDDDPVFRKLMALLNKFNRAFDLPNSLVEFIPFLRCFPALTFLGPLYDCSNFYYKIFGEIIAKKRQDLGQHQHEPRDLVDGFILEMDKNLDQEDRECINDEQLLAILRDLVIAGADTVNNSLEYGILLLALYPHVQAKVQAEIKSIVGDDRAPVYADKARMSYTEATLLEILRLGSVVPATARSAKAGCKLGDVRLKKGSMFVINIYGIHRSKDLWDDPEVFRPERFLDSDNRIVNAEKIIPFGHGRRGCMGASVAKVSMFIFFVTLFRKFEFRVSHDYPEPSLGNIRGLTRGPQAYFVKVAKRNQLVND